MHSVSAPRGRGETGSHRAIASGPGRLQRRSPDERSRLVVWDVGLGAASNAMAAIHRTKREIARAGPTALRRLNLISFERDLDPLILARATRRTFPSPPWAPHGLLNKGRWGLPRALIDWQLLRGDFLEHPRRLRRRPDLFIIDPFSSKTIRTLAHRRLCADPPGISRAAETLYLCGRHGGARALLLAGFLRRGRRRHGTQATTRAFTPSGWLRPGSRVHRDHRRGMAHPRRRPATPSSAGLDAVQQAAVEQRIERPSPVHEPLTEDLRPGGIARHIEHTGSD